MSKRKSTSTPAHSTTNANAAAGAANESYDSDNGFVVDDDDGAPRGKKVKVGHGAEKGGKKEGGKKEGGKKGDVKNEGGKKGDMKGKGRGDGIGIGGGGAQVGKDGECFWELTSKRRIGVSEFKGKCMIHIREYYEKDGEALPTKKGISLPVEQFNTLIKVLPHIETVLVGKGQRIERPDYSGAAAVDDEDVEDDDEDDEEMEEEGKRNFEATSDEE